MLVKSFILSFLFVWAYGQSVAQGSWNFAAPTDGAGTIGAENCRAVCTDALGNVYITGNFNGGGIPTDFDLSSGGTNTFTSSGTDGFIASYDKNGNFRWKTIVSGSATDFGAPSGAICTDGTFVWVAGTCNVSVSSPAATIISSTNTVTITSPGSGVDVFVAKLNCSNGATVWQQGFGSTGGNDFGMGICVDPNGYCYVSGAYSGPFALGSIVAPSVSGTSDMFIAKFSPSGTMTRFNSGGSTLQDMVNAGGGLVYVPGATPAIVATGHTGAATASFGAFTGLSNAGGFDAFLVEIDTALSNFTNALVFGSTGSDELLSAVYDSYSGDVFVSGFCSGNITFPGRPTLTGLGAQDIIMARYNVASNGFTWSLIAGGAGNDRGWCVTSDRRGGIFLSGYSAGSCSFGSGISMPANAGLNDLFVVRYNPSGIPQWIVTATSTGSEEARGISSYVETTPVYTQNILVSGHTNGANVPFGSTTVGNDGGNDFFLARLVDLTAPLVPLRLLSFSGSRKNDYNQLLWKTANEANTNRFEIQSSSNGNNYTTVATVAAKGSGDNSYSYQDSRSLPGKLYYRLKMVDNDEKFTYSTVLWVSGTEAAAMAFFPSPVKDLLSINGATVGNTLTVTDINGKVLKTIRITHSSFTIDMGQYPAGMYFIKAGEGIARPVIKE